MQRLMPQPVAVRCCFPGSLSIAKTEGGVERWQGCSKEQPSLHARERVIIGDALSRREQEQLLVLLAKVQQSITAHADDPVDHAARRIRPERLRPT